MFVTVGTTRFDDLVGAVARPEFAAAVAHLRLPRAPGGVARIVMQVGASSLPPPFEARGDDTHGSVVRGGVVYEWYRLKPSTAADIAGAALVVSHAGAGSIFDVLRAARSPPPPLIVVVNTALADNHQAELAGALAAGGHLVMCEPHQLARVAATYDADAASGRVPLPPPATAAFVHALDCHVGWRRE